MILLHSVHTLPTIAVYTVVFNIQLISVRVPSFFKNALGNSYVLPGRV
jgi:hypothetical protein